MIVPWHDPDEMIQVNDFSSTPNCFGGDVRGQGPSPAESLVNPRSIGFGREEKWYIPVYWCVSGE